MYEYPRITYEKDSAQYEARLGFSDMKVVTDILRDQGFYDMQVNEDFVSQLILATRRAGVFETAELSKNGQVNDGPNGEPAVQIYKEGKFVYAASAKDGRVTEDLQEKDLRAASKAEYVEKPKAPFTDQPNRTWFSGNI